MAKQKLRKKQVANNDAQQVKKLFTVTAIIVLIALVVIYFLFN